MTRLGNFYRGLEFALAGMMMAPDFLLRVDQTLPGPHKNGLHELDRYSKPPRLRSFTTNSTPDADLIRTAAAGQPDSPSGVAQRLASLDDRPTFIRGEEGS